MPRQITKNTKVAIPVYDLLTTKKLHTFLSTLSILITYGIEIIQNVQKNISLTSV